MLVLSLGFLFVGITKMNKGSKYHALFSSIAGCGAGAFYISCLIGYFGFKLLSDFTLLLCISIWLISMIVLSKMKSKMFLYISNVGLIIATILVAVNWSSLYIGAIVYFVGLVALYICNSEGNYNHDSLFFIQIPIVTVILSSIYESDFVYCGLLACLSVLMIFQLLRYDLSKYRMTNIIALVITVVCQCLMMAFYASNLQSQDWIAYLLFIICVLSYSVVIYLKYVDTNKLLVNASTILFVIFTFIPYYMILGTMSPYAQIIGFWPYLILFMCVGAFGKQFAFRFFSYGYLFTNISHIASYESNHYYHIHDYPNITLLSNISFILTICVMIGVCVWLCKNYSKFDKYCFTGLVLYLILVGIFMYDAPGWIALILYTTVIAIMNTFIFRKSITGEYEIVSVIIGYAFNMLIMIVATCFIAFSHRTLNLTAGFLCAIVSYCINVKHIFSTSISKNLCGIYVSLKFMFLMLVILNHFDAVSFVVSISCLLFAIAIIVIGFYVKVKSFRIYGLIVTLISVVKLLLLDIEYDSDIMRPLGFFVAGILCFVISWIYSRLEKQLSEEEESSNS